MKVKKALEFQYQEVAGVKTVAPVFWWDFLNCSQLEQRANLLDEQCPVKGVPEEALGRGGYEGVSRGTGLHIPV